MDSPGLLSNRRANLSRDNYIFISYSHLDKEKVYSDLSALYDNCVNYWYDQELYVGDKWDEKVRKTIESENCKGALIYISPSSIKSEAVEKEIGVLFDRLEKNSDFVIMLVSPYNLSVLEIVRNIFVELKDMSGAELERTFPQKRLATVVEKLSSNIIYLVPSADNEHIGKIVNDFKTRGLPVFADDESLLEDYTAKLNMHQDNEIYSLEFGCYPSVESRDDLFGVKEGLEIRNSKKYFTVNKITYEFSRLGWKMLRLNSNLMTICPNEALIFSGLDKVEEKLSEFIELAFSDNKQAVQKVEIPTTSQVEEIQKLLGGASINKFAKAQAPKMLPEILFFKGENGYALYNRALKKMNVPVRSNVMGYVMPIVTIDLSKI